MRSKGQVSIEILIVLSILIVGAVAFGIYYINHLNTNIKDQDKNNKVDDTVKNFLNSMDENEPMTVSIIYNPTTHTCTAVTKFNQGQVTYLWDDGTTSDNIACPATLVGDVDVNATDERGNSAIASITFDTATFTVQITSPMNESTHQFNSSINFNMTPNNNTGAVTCSWSSDISGAIGSGSSCNINYSGLSAGNHVIQLTATDTGSGATATDTVNITVLSPPAFTVQITNPENESTHLYHSPINFNMTPDNNTGTVTCIWKSDSVSIGTICNLLNYSLLLSGTHTITLEATDGSGATDTATIYIRVSPPPDFIVNITSPTTSAQFTPTQSIDFNATSVWLNPNTDFNCSWDHNGTQFGSANCNLSHALPFCGLNNIKVTSTNITTLQTDTDTLPITIQSNMTGSIQNPPYGYSSAHFTQTFTFQANHNGNYGTPNCNWYYGDPRIPIKTATLYDCDPLVDVLPIGDSNVYLDMWDNCGGIIHDYSPINIHSDTDIYGNYIFSAKIYNPVDHEIITTSIFNLRAVYDRNHSTVTCKWYNIATGLQIASGCNTIADRSIIGTVATGGTKIQLVATDGGSTSDFNITCYRG